MLGRSHECVLRDRLEDIDNTVIVAGNNFHEMEVVCSTDKIYYSLFDEFFRVCEDYKIVVLWDGANRFSIASQGEDFIPRNWNC